MKHLHTKDYSEFYSKALMLGLSPAEFGTRLRLVCSNRKHYRDLLQYALLYGTPEEEITAQKMLESDAAILVGDYLLTLERGALT